MDERKTDVPIQSENAKSIQKPHSDPGVHNKRVAVGFDGFIDIVVRPVRVLGKGGPEFFTTIEQFGQYIAGKASLSCSIDLDKIGERPGGNMPNYVKALAALGIETDCIGTVGYPERNSLFDDLAVSGRVRGIANPGVSNALEFRDGKVFLACNGDVDQVNYRLLEERIGRDGLIQWLIGADCLSLLNWSEMKQSTSIWQGLLDNEIGRAHV